jgi:hypothetical protein
MSPLQSKFRVMSKIAGRFMPALLVGCLLAASMGTAAAQPTEASAGVDFTYGSVSNSPAIVLGGGSDTSLIGINLHGHYAIGHGLLVGGHLPLAHVRFDDDSATSLGNLTAELNYRLTNGPRNKSWIDTSFSLGTADNNGDGSRAAITYAIFAMEDPGKYAPDTTTLRVMYRHYFGEPKLRFDFQGGAQYLSIENTDNAIRVPIIFGVRAAVGPRLQLVGRFSTFWLLNAEDDEDDFLHMLEAGVNILQVGRGQVQALIYYPLDEVYRDLYEVWGLKVGFTTNI